MKKTLLPAVLLAALFGLLCAPPLDNEALARAKKLKAVQFSVNPKGADGVEITYTPDPLRVSKLSHKLRFSAFNNLDRRVDEVRVTFKTDDPFDGGFVIDGIASGEEDDTAKREVRDDLVVTDPPTKYEYKIEVIIGGQVVAKIDPEIEIAN